MWMSESLFSCSWAGKGPSPQGRWRWPGVRGGEAQQHSEHLLSFLVLQGHSVELKQVGRTEGCQGGHR